MYLILLIHGFLNMKKIYLGLGSNLGDREHNLKEAFARIEEHIGHTVKSSSLYETEPWGFNANENFLNAVIEVETELNPCGVLGAILMIETLLGRTRGEKQYSSRVIDIDILLYNELIVDEVSLKIPHPLLHKRMFVLVPLCEIAPQLIHPVLNVTVATLFASCMDKSLVRLHKHKTS
jgi:2-amino-4-hydroxy-6-hydroxymethyldihydropteridine diphosphokinase